MGVFPGSNTFINENILLKTVLKGKKAEFWMISRQQNLVPRVVKKNIRDSIRKLYHEDFIEGQLALQRLRAKRKSNDLILDKTISRVNDIATTQSTSTDLIAIKSHTRRKSVIENSTKKSTIKKSPRRISAQRKSTRR